MFLGRHFSCATLALGIGVLGSAAQAQDTITIGFVTHSQGDPFIQQIIDGAQAAAHDLGVTLKVAQQSGGAPEGTNRCSICRLETFTRSGTRYS